MTGLHIAPGVDLPLDAVTESGGYRNALSRLRSLEIASGRGELTLNPELVG